MKKEIIKTETATADFAYIGDERIYIYCRMEIYRQGSPEGAGKAGNPEGNVSKTLADLHPHGRGYSSGQGLCQRRTHSPRGKTKPGQPGNSGRKPKGFALFLKPISPAMGTFFLVSRQGRGS